MSGVVLGLFVQLAIGILILLINRSEAPKDFWRMRKKFPHADLLDYEKDILRGVSNESPKGVTDRVIYQRIYSLRRTSLGVGWGIGLIMTSIFWLGVVYSNPDLFAY